MHKNRLVSVVIALCLSAPFISFARAQNRVPPGQGPLRRSRRQKPPPFEEITPDEKGKILAKKRVKPDPTSKVLSYHVQHGYDQKGWLELNGVLYLLFDGDYARFDPANPDCGIWLQFNWIAVNRLHLVLFTIYVDGKGGNFDVQTTECTNNWKSCGNDPLAVFQNTPVSIRHGTNHVPVIVQANKFRDGGIGIFFPPLNSLFEFEKVTIELVK